MVMCSFTVLESLRGHCLYGPEALNRVKTMSMSGSHTKTVIEKRTPG